MRIALVLLSLGGSALAASTVRVRGPAAADPRIGGAAKRLEAVSARTGYSVEVLVASPETRIPPKGRKPEGFYISVSGKQVRVVGFDAAGAMYGCLELERRLTESKRLPERLEFADAPAMSLRGACIFFMKLGTYDYPVTPAEFPFFYDKKLWLEYLDFLARNRFNYIAFWNGHPFDYFVKLERFPEAQDGMEPGLLERNHDMLMWLGTEAEKRNIWLMFQFYNIHTSVYFQKAHGLPAWNRQPTPLLADYTGYAIERFVSEFPSIGLYICPGEALRLEYTDQWINNVILAAVKRTGKTPPIMVRAWGIDRPHMMKVAGNYSRLYTERKFNVEMVAATEIDPENAEWAKITGNHVVNIHCMANLEPFRWGAPTFIQKCIRSSIAAGGTGLHLYPRKVWRWPYGCDRTSEKELQWNRDWMWFEAWARYAWEPERDPAAERRYWVERLKATYGPAAAEAVLTAYESAADVLPAIQRLIWLGNDNHTVVAAGIKLDQLQKAKGIPFLDLPGLLRVPAYLDALKARAPIAAGSPVEFLAGKVAEAEAALRHARRGAQAATRNKEDARRLVTDLEATLLVARFYLDKVKAAAAKALFDAGVEPGRNSRECLRYLNVSLEHFRALTKLTEKTYESLSDVPAWNPVRNLPCPYHWSDVLPVFENEFAEVRRQLSPEK